MAFAPDIGTLETLAFVKSALPPRARRVLEVGCGEGALAMQLAASGVEVVAIDARREPVMAARTHGIDARVAELSDFDTAPVDAVIFSRSLHLATRLDAAVDRSAELLKPGGRLILEEPVHDEIDAATAAWAYGSIDLLRSVGVDVGAEMRHEGDPLTSWNSEHAKLGHHGGRTMSDAIVRRFELLRVEPAPCFFRHPLRVLRDARVADRVARALLDSERRLIAVRSILPLGRRIVGEPLGAPAR